MAPQQRVVDPLDLPCDERLALLKTKNNGWQDYKFVNPVTKQFEPKSMYFEKYEDLVINCGIYKYIPPPGRRSRGALPLARGFPHAAALPFRISASFLPSFCRHAPARAVASAGTKDAISIGVRKP